VVELARAGAVAVSAEGAVGEHREASAVRAAPGELLVEDLAGELLERDVDAAANEPLEVGTACRDRLLDRARDERLEGSVLDGCHGRILARATAAPPYLLTVRRRARMSTYAEGARD
jgi:hypothetical protein